MLEPPGLAAGVVAAGDGLDPGVVVVVGDGLAPAGLAPEVEGLADKELLPGLGCLLAWLGMLSCFFI